MLVSSILTACSSPGGNSSTFPKVASPPVVLRVGLERANGVAGGCGVAEDCRGSPAASTRLTGRGPPQRVRQGGWRGLVGPAENQSAVRAAETEGVRQYVAQTFLTSDVGH